MSYNEPPDALTYDHDLSDQDYAQQVRYDVIEALVGGYSETDDGQHDAPLDEFAQWVCDAAEQDEHEDARNYLYMMVKHDGAHEDLLGKRRDLVNEFMDHRGEL